MQSEADESSTEPAPGRSDVAISTVNPSASEIRRAPVVRAPMSDIESHISEFAADVAGSLSPFGDDLEFPLPLERLSYQHPGPANRPALAGD